MEPQQDALINFLRFNIFQITIIKFKICRWGTPIQQIKFVRCKLKKN
jgi:hypothetical protein